MPSVKKAWRTLLAGVLGEKAGMKEAKVVKRCVKQARQDPALSALTGDQAAASLAAFLARWVALASPMLSEGLRQSARGIS